MNSVVVEEGAAKIIIESVTKENAAEEVTFEEIAVEEEENCDC